MNSKNLFISFLFICSILCCSFNIVSAGSDDCDANTQLITLPFSETGTTQTAAPSFADCRGTRFLLFFICV